MGMGKYSKTRSRQNYIIDRLGTKSDSTKAIFNTSIKSIDTLCQKQFKVKNLDAVIIDVLKMKIEDREDEVTAIIQEWINLMAKTKQFNSIKVLLSSINKYLKYYKIRIDFNDEIEFPQKIQEERYPISLDEIRRIIEDADFKQKGYYLCLISSGARPVEIIGLKKRQFFWTGKRYGAKIPAHLTKKKISRTVFFTTECTYYLKILLKKYKDENTVFTDNPILKNARSIAGYVLNYSLKKLHLDYKFESTGYSKINLYCFRGYFFTKAIRVLNEDIAHAMIGHGAYQQVYQRRTDKEKEELFIDLEPELLIFSQAKNTEKIKRLEEVIAKSGLKDEKLDELAETVRDLQSTGSMTDEVKKFIKELVKDQIHSNSKLL